MAKKNQSINEIEANINLYLTEWYLHTNASSVYHNIYASLNDDDKKDANHANLFLLAAQIMRDEIDHDLEKVTKSISDKTGISYSAIFEDFYPCKRHFENMIFMGAGNYSLYRLSKLFHEIKLAVSNLNFVQQPSHEEDDSKQNAVAYERIENTVRDVAMALTGKEIIFVEKG